MRKADNLPPSCAVVTKYGNLNFLEPSGPVQACNGTDLLSFCCRIKHIIDGNIAMTGRRGRIRKQLLDDVREIGDTGS